MSRTCISVTPRSDITPEQARDLRARALQFVFDCYARKKSDPVNTPDDARGGFKINDSQAERSKP